MIEGMGLNFVWFIGVVEDRDDPSKLGRCRVRCLGFHTDDINILPTKDLPWAYPMQPITSASMQGIGETPLGPLNGTWVVGFFRDGVSAQEPVIMGTLGGIPEELPNTNKGFNGDYPLSLINHSDHGINEPDTNRLARNDDEHKVVTNKKDDYSSVNPTGRITSTPTANGGVSWSEPNYNSIYNAEYPYNHVRESESGHIEEIDDTEGYKRLNIQHSSGTFTEIHNDGTKITRVVGDNYEVVINNNNVLVKGNCNLTIDSDCRTYIKGNWNIQVDGSKTEVIKGAVVETYESGQTTDITGVLNLDASEEIDVDSALINLN